MNLSFTIILLAFVSINQIASDSFCAVRPICQQAAKNQPRGDSSNGMSRSNPKYNWKTGDEHYYEYTIDAEVDGAQQLIEGACSYKVGREKITGHTPDESNGTAFAVTSNGYLVTCAHIVEDGGQIEVSIAGKKYPATVVELDPDRDLALLRIQAANLIALPLGDSKTVLQGQDIRAVGFPLTDVLGNDPKITKGTISGIISRDAGRREFQLDASINPGNSGGPIVDERGNAIGIVSSKLLGITVSSVGLAVPSQQIREMLLNNKIQTLRAPSQIQLDGPSLFQSVRPSIGLVTVRGAHRETRFHVTYSGNINSKTPQSTRSLNKPMINGKFIASKSGEVSDFQGDDQLPFLLGPVGLLCMEDLNNRRSPQWSSVRQSDLAVISESSSRYGSMIDELMSRYSFPRTGLPGELSRRSRNRYNTFGQRIDVTKYPAIERTRYVIQAETENEIKIKKRYEFQTVKNRNKPFMQVNGNGILTFDKSVGLPSQLVYNATLTFNDKGRKTEIPIKLTYRLRDPKELAVERKAARERMAKRKEEARIAATVPNPERVANILAEINSNDSYAYSGFSDLQKLAVVESKQDEVVELAQKSLSSFSKYQVNVLLNVVAKWGRTDEQKIKILLAELKNRTSDISYDTLDIFREKLPVVEEYRDEVIATVEAVMKSKSASSSSVSESAMKLLRKWGTKGKEAQILVSQIRAKMSAGENTRTYEIGRSLDNLLKVPVVDDAREKVVSLSKDLLDKYPKDSSIKPDAMKLILTWAEQAEQLKIFTKFLANTENELDYSNRKQIMTVMGQSNDPMVIKVLLLRLKNRDVYDEAKKALINIGPECEDLALVAFKKIPEAREKITEILEKVGTEKCIPILERYELDTHESYQRDQIHKSRVAILDRIKKSPSKGDKKEPDPFGEVGDLFDDK